MGFQDLYVKLIDDIDYDPIVSFIEPHLSKSQTILDAGCGSGVILVPLTLLGYDILGVDINSKMLSYADQALKQKNLKSRLYEHDLRTPLAQSFDVILLFNDVINYFKGVKKVFSVLKNGLNPNGFMLFDFYKESYLNEMDGYIEKDIDPVPYEWRVTVKKATLTHNISDEHGQYKVVQYVYPIEYYLNSLEQLGLKITLLEGPDERKYYVKASL